MKLPSLPTVLSRVLLVALTLGASGYAQQPAWPAGQPSFSLPRDFTPTPQELGVSGGLLNAVRAKFECKKCNGQEPGGRVGAVMLRLGAAGNVALVTSYAADRCNENGACSIWLFGLGGEPQELDWGASYSILTTGARPVPDIAVRGSAGGQREFVHLFRFSNGRYVPAGCDALVDRNDMGDVSVGPCR